MLKYIRDNNQYQSHDITVDVGPGHAYSKTGQLRFRTWTNKGEAIRWEAVTAEEQGTHFDILAVELGLADVQGDLILFTAIISKPWKRFLVFSFLSQRNSVSRLFSNTVKIQTETKKEGVYHQRGEFLLNY